MDSTQDQAKHHKISTISFKEQCNLVRSFIDDKDRIDILNFIEEDQKNKLFLLNDNLLNTERTDWKYHHNPKFRPYYNIILRELYECMEAYSKQYGGGNVDGRMENNHIKTSIMMIDSWFAKSRKNAFVEPHNHGHGYGFFSFACYLKLPSLKSSLKFSNSDLTWRQNLSVREGDVVVFPSHLPHWTADVEEGRSIYSGNFVWEVKHTCECEFCLEEKRLNSELF